MKRKVRKAVFPAAGLGTRFLPATKAQPKEMLPLVDKPLIQYVIEEAVDSGIESIIIITGRGKNAIEDHFDVSYELENLLSERGKQDLLETVQKVSNLAHISYVRQKKALGLGHAVLMARELVGDEPFAVMLGDDIIHAQTPCLRQMMDVYEAYSMEPETGCTNWTAWWKSLLRKPPLPTWPSSGVTSWNRRFLRCWQPRRPELEVKFNLPTASERFSNRKEFTDGALRENATTPAISWGFWRPRLILRSAARTWATLFGNT